LTGRTGADIMSGAGEPRAASLGWPRGGPALRVTSSLLSARSCPINKLVPREKLRQRPEVHVAGLCLDTSSRRGIKLLIAERVPGRALYGGKWEGCGGQLAPGETFAEDVRRHFRLELGLEVRVLEDFHCFYKIVRRDEPLIPGIRFLCELAGAPPAAIESPNHSEVHWVSEAEFRRMAARQFTGGLHGEVINLLGRYKEATK
jgi:ADP-ribose pyrophosphatase YjhB (NUDIX family)